MEDSTTEIKPTSMPNTPAEQATPATASQELQTPSTESVSHDVASPVPASPEAVLTPTPAPMEVNPVTPPTPESTPSNPTPEVSVPVSQTSVGAENSTNPAFSATAMPEAPTQPIDPNAPVDYTQATNANTAKAPSEGIFDKVLSVLGIGRKN